MKKFIGTIAMVLSCLYSTGQGIPEDIENVSRFFSETDKYAVDVKVKVTEKGKEDGISYAQTYYLQKVDESIYYKMGGIEFLINTDYALTVREEQKYIHVVNLSNKENVFQNGGKELGEVLNEIDTIEFLGEENGEMVYRLEDLDGLITEAKAYINVEDSRLNKLLYYYQDSQTDEMYYEVVIEYDNWKKGSDFKEELKRPEKYVVKDRKGFRTTEAYNDFMLVVDNTIISG